MISIRSRVFGRENRDGDFIIQRRAGARMLNGALLVILIAAAVTARSSHIQSAGLGASIFYLVITIALAYNAGENRKICFSRSRKVYEYRHSWFGIPFSRRQIPYTLLKSIELKGMEIETHTRLRKNPGFWALSIKLDPERVPEAEPTAYRIEDSSDRSELELVAKSISEYTQLPFNPD